MHLFENAPICELCKHRFGVQLLQNPQLCCSTVGITWEDLHGMGVWAGGVGHEDPLPDVDEVLVSGRPVEQGLHEGPVQPLTSRVRQALCTTHPFADAATYSGAQ